MKMFLRNSARFTQPFARAALAAGLLTAQLAVADTEPWIGNPGVTTTTNWSDVANWSGTSHNPNDNILIFGTGFAVAQGVINNVVDTSTNCFAMVYTNTAGYHNTLIAAGQTLKIDGNNNGFALTANPGGQVQTTNTISGATGTLLITGAAAGSVYIATTNSSSGGVPATVDMSGLGTFIISNTSAATAMFLGTGANRSDGVLFLAMTNYISLSTNGTGNASALLIGDNTSNNGSSPGGQLNLGSTNQIFADNIGVGLSKQTVGTMRFNPAVTNGGANPVVYIRGFSGTAVKKWAIGDGLTQSGTSVGGSGNVDFRCGTVNAVVNAMVLGRPSPTSITTPSSTGTLSLNAGSISVVNLTNAMTTIAGGTTNQSAKGTITINDAASFSAANVVMAIFLGGSGTSVAALNVGGGTLAVGTVTLGTGTSSINLTNGTLIVTNNVGAPGAPLTTLNLNGGTVQLTLNGGSIVTNIVATTVGTNGNPTTISIASIGGVLSPTTFPLISYTGTDPFGNLALATPLPNSFTGSLVDDTAKQTIDLSVSPPGAAGSLLWVGATNSVLTSSWDFTTTNWLNTVSMLPAAYVDLDAVRFDDTASNNVVSLATAVAPFSIFVTNNSLNYTFNGAGKIGGTAYLVKTGPGMLTLSESGGDNFNSGIVITNGTLVLDNAGSSISGGLNIVGGTVQVGNNDANGALPSGTVTDNGSIVFDRNDTLTVSTTIGGTGSVAKNANNTLTLSGTSSYAGGVSANNGTLRLSSASAAGTGAITVNPGGTAVVTTLTPNSIVLSGGILGVSTNFPMTNTLTVSANTTNLIYNADPQNLGAANAQECAWVNILQGSGSFIVGTVTNNNNPDQGNGFRLRGTAAGSFSGNITFSNNVKGELQTTVAGPFSPAGSGTIYLVCGAYNATNTQTCPVIGGYSEFNLRNNSTGSTVFGNNVVVQGQGTTVLDPLGSAPAPSATGMGSLQIGGGQEIGIYTSAGTSNHIVTFTSVTLTGGNARFSPKLPLFGSVNSVGGNFSLGPISQLAASGIIIAGLSNVTLTGVNTYSGNTTISNGTLSLTGSATIASTPNIIVNGGATFDVSGLSSTFALGASQTLTGNNATGTVNGNVNMNLGALMVNYTNGTPTLTEANGALTMNNNAVTVTVQGTPLGVGSYKLVSAGTGGSVAGSVNTTPVVNGAGSIAGHSVLLAIVGSELYLVVSNQAPVIANIVTNNVPIGSTWKIKISDLRTAAGWSDPDGDPVTFNGVNSLSANGTNITSDATYIYYNGAVTGQDSFTYTVTDGYLTTTGTVYLEAIPATLPPIANPTLDGNGHPTFSGSGIPGYVLGVEYATSINGPWANAGTTTVNGTGSWTFTDTSQTNPGTIFYRLYYPYNPSNPPQ